MMSIKAKFLILLNLCSLYAFGQQATTTAARDSELTNMINLLKQDNFEKIYTVKDKIINYQKAAIPRLIELLKDTSFVKLRNTGDLIYPGATDFYGHGGVIGYNIDWMSIRAAWLLEEITFKNFGYLKSSYYGVNLQELYQKNHAIYIGHDLSKLTPEDLATQKTLRRHLVKLADTVERWWRENEATWTRFNALKDALSDADPIVQGNAIHYMGFESTVCDDLTVDSYESELKPLLLPIAKSGRYEAEEAKKLYQVNPSKWLAWKARKD